MKKRSISRFAVSVAAVLLVLGGVAHPVFGQSPAQGELSDERVMELARGYFELLRTGEYERLWGHVSPEGQQRFGTFERFRTASETVMGRLGSETAVVRETVEPAPPGLVAHKLYHRVSRYTGEDGRPMRITIGLVSDGTIGGLNAGPAQ